MTDANPSFFLPNQKSISSLVHGTVIFGKPKTLHSDMYKWVYTETPIFMKISTWTQVLSYIKSSFLHMSLIQFVRDKIYLIYIGRILLCINKGILTIFIRTFAFILLPNDNKIHICSSIKQTKTKIQQRKHFLLLIN